MTSEGNKKTLKLPFEPCNRKFEQILLYETSSFFYLIGSDEKETIFKVIKFNRRIIKPESLSEILIEDPLIYNKADLSDMLEMIHEGNKQSGGLIKLSTAYGIIGFIKFLDCYYITLITSRKHIGYINNNSIYSIKSTEVYPIKPRETIDSNTLAKMWRKLNQKLNQTSSEIAENRYMGLFQFIDISKDFFFSYNYDLTNSFQHNYLTRMNSNSNQSCQQKPFQDTFIWNFYQTEEFINLVGHSNASCWLLPVIHGSFQQRRFSIHGKLIDLILIARRSRHYAGTRYLKRGINVHGKVANDCEIEQILQSNEGIHSQFCSLLQIRGSIPTYWSQETSVTQPKPPIIVNRIDPLYLATQEHFNDLIVRYNLPIIVLDLVKHEERRPREVIVGKEYRLALEIVNQSIPLRYQIRYIGLDYTRLNKSVKHNKTVDKPKDIEQSNASVGKEWDLLIQSKEFNNSNNNITPIKNNNISLNINHRIDLFTELEDIAGYALSQTGFFCSTSEYLDRVDLVDEELLNKNKLNNKFVQNGILRTNCIDCLDRTNGGQFALGMKFLSVSLVALGLSLDSSNKIYLELMEMFSDLGDHIAVQYGGSEAHNKMTSTDVTTPTKTIKSGISVLLFPIDYLRNVLGTTKSSNKQGELLTSIKRYYSNAFTDNVKQDAINIFLGCYEPSSHPIPLWDLETDYDLHNKTLHPPDPYIHHILFNDMIIEIKRLLENQLDNQLDGQLECSTNCNNESKSNEKLDSSVDSKLLQKYFIKNIDSSTNIPSHILNIIKRSEKRKHIDSLMKIKLNNALEKWWKDAIDKYIERHTPIYFTKSRTELISDEDINVFTNKRVDYYENIYNPNELTLFDDLLSNDSFLTPIVLLPDSKSNQSATIVSSVIPQLTRSLTRKKTLQINNDIDDLFDDNDHILSPTNHRIYNTNHLTNRTTNSPNEFSNNSNNLTTNSNDLSITNQSNTITNSGFQISKYVREIGQKARNIVGGLLRKDEIINPLDNNKDNMIDITNNQLNHNNIWDYYNNYNDDIISMNMFNITTNQSIKLYDSYMNQYNNPMTLVMKADEPTDNKSIDKSMSRSTDKSIDKNMNNLVKRSINQLLDISTDISTNYSLEYALACHDINININDVKSIEQLSIDNYISTIITNDGEYKDCNHLDDANIANSLLYHVFNCIENDLNNNLYQLIQSNDQINDDAINNQSTNSITNLTSNLSNNNKIKINYEKALKLSSVTRERIVKLSKHMKLGRGLESSIVNKSHRYLYDQTLLYRELDFNRLSKRLSSYSTSTILLNYISMMYSKEGFCYDLDNFLYILHDSSSFHDNYQDITQLITNLYSIYESIKNEKNYKLNNHNKIIDNVDSNTSSYLDALPLDRGPSMVEYEGFQLISSDVYVKINNPYIITNEITTYTFSLLKKRLNHKMT